MPREYNIIYGWAANRAVRKLQAYLDAPFGTEREDRAYVKFIKAKRLRDRIGFFVGQRPFI